LHSTMAEIFLGSVAHELTHRAIRPLAVVPTKSHDVRVEALGREHRRVEGEPPPRDHFKAESEAPGAPTESRRVI
jgi:hypothetical protein